MLKRGAVTALMVGYEHSTFVEAVMAVVFT